MPGNKDNEAAASGRLFPSDLDEVVERVSDFATLRDSRIFVTGGTGFVGRWLLETLLRADNALHLGVHVVVLTRDPETFCRRSPHLAMAPAVELHAGDVRTFEFPLGRFDRVLHLAAETNTDLRNPDAATYFDVIAGGTSRVLDLAERSGVRDMFVASSGAVYGRQPSGVERLAEESPLAPLTTDTGAAYGEAKRASEMLAFARSERTGLNITAARCFAFVGPYLPLDSGFAVGNFLRDALVKGEILVRGDGKPIRTYMYAGEMAAWLWTIALRGSSRHPYNVGSDRPVSVVDLATLVAQAVGGSVSTRVLGEHGRTGAGMRYVPDVSRAKSELGLAETITLDEALSRTVTWYRTILASQHEGGAR